MIPFNEIGVDYKPGMLLSLILESRKVESPERPEGMSGQSPMGGMSGGGMQGGGGGGMHGGGMPGGGGPSQASSTSSPQIKIKIKHLQLL